MDEAEGLRGALVDRLRETGALGSPAVEAAMRAVPRHLFVPGVALDHAYADGVVPTKQDSAGVAISAASQPSIVALMLEQLDVRPGHRVLEIGAGTGYNAALLGYLVGDAGRVTTVDVDADIVDGARRGLTAAGVANVDVVLGDGAHAYAPNAPYDRIIATVGAGRVPRAWLDQLAPDGRLVVPLRIRGSVARSIAFAREPDGSWRSRGSEGCAFMPLRGIADDAARVVPVSGDGRTAVVVHRDQNVGDLRGVLDETPVETWTGVFVTPRRSLEWLWLWLACRLDNGVSRLVPPGGGETVTMAAVDGGNLAYLSVSAAHELGVVARGPDAARFAARVSEEVRRWDRERRSQRVEFRLNGPGQFTFAHVSVSWRPAG